MRRLIGLMVMVSCGGEPFTGQIGESGEAGESTLGGTFAEYPNAGEPSFSGSSFIASGGNPSIGNAAGAGGVGSPISSPWKCRVDGPLCQCYSDPSQFEPGWLPLDECPASQLCTNRENLACVCWDSVAAYENALNIHDTIAVEECP